MPEKPDNNLAYVVLWNESNDEMCVVDLFVPPFDKQLQDFGLTIVEKQVEDTGNYLFIWDLLTPKRVIPYGEFIEKHRLNDWSYLDEKR